MADLPHIPWNESLDYISENGKLTSEIATRELHAIISKFDDSNDFKIWDKMRTIIPVTATSKAIFRLSL